MARLLRVLDSSPDLQRLQTCQIGEENVLLRDDAKDATWWA